MKLIIDISEGIYKHVDTIQNGSIGAKQIINSVKNGIPAYKAIPSAEPKTGHREYNDIYDHYLCGNCKTVVMDYDNFCPNCGCRMVEPQERSEE